MKREKSDYFARKMFLRQFTPAMISALGLAFGDMADAIVVGRRMGVVGLTAISLSLPVFMVLNVIMHGLGLGGSICFSKQLAEGKKEEAAGGFQAVVLAALLIGSGIAVTANLALEGLLGLLGTRPADGEVFLACGTYVRIIASGAPLIMLSYIMNYYLRNADQERLASLGFTVGNLSDIALNIILVLGFDLEVTGAALSTLAGMAISLGIYLTGMALSARKGAKVEGMRLWPFAPDWKGLPANFRVGFSTSSQYLFSMLFYLVVNNVLIRLGGSVAVAVFDMLMNASYLILYLYDGTAKAMQPLVSNFYGECNFKGVKRILRLGVNCGMVAGIAASCFIFAFPHLICQLFGIQDGEALSLGMYALRIYVPGAVFGGLGILLESYYQSSDQEKDALLIAFLRGTGVLIPFSVLFSFAGLKGFWWMFPATELCSLGILFLKRRFCTKKKKIDEERVYTRVIQGRNEDLGPMLGEIEEFCEKWGSTVSQKYYMNMSVEEMCLAIMEQGLKDREGYIQVTLIAQEDETFELHIRDSAVSFNPFQMESEKIGEEAFHLEAMGIMVVKEKAKEFSYRRYQGFNTLIIRI